VNELAGLGPLARLVVRRDRVRFATWLAGVFLLVIVTAASTKGLYPTQASLDSAAKLAETNPVALAFNGPAQALDTIGGQVAFQLGSFGFIVVGLLSVLLVGRLTRTEEDSGRLELVRSMPVGRRAPLATALAVVMAVQVLAGALTTAALVSQGLAVTGSVALAVSYVAFGLFMLAVTALTAQVAENPRVATGTAGAVLGVSFLLRAIGDTGPEWLSWISPMGWAQRMRPYAGERWWPFALLLVAGLAVLAGAVRVADARDFGAGVVAPRAGPARASASLGSPVGLAFRLHRGAILWWVVSVIVLAGAYGALADSIDDFVRDSPDLEDIIASVQGASLADSYLATSLLVVALLAAGPALQIALRLRSEETEHRTEMITATPTSRARWMSSHLLVALGAGALAVVSGGAALGGAYAATGADATQVPRLAAASLVYVPAVWVLTGLAVALFGVVPRAVAAVWGALAVCFVIAMFGPILDLPAWALDISPFQQTPAAPASDVRVVPIVVLLGIAAVFAGTGLAGFRRREVG